MRQLFCAIASAALLASASGASAQTKEEIINGIIAAENMGLEGVDNILLKTETMGIGSVTYLEKMTDTELTLENGQKVYVMRNVPMTEMQQRQSPQNALSSASPADLRRAAAELEGQRGMVEGEFQKELTNSGLGGLGGGMIANMLMSPPKTDEGEDQPWLSANPGSMLHLYAKTMGDLATAKEQQAAQNPAAEARQNLTDLTQLAARSQVLAPRTINDRPAVGLFSDGLNQRQVVDGQDFTLNSVSMWVDAERYVPLRLKMDGVMRADGQSRAVSIVREDLDYRTVPGCNGIYKPWRSVMKIAGVMSPKEQAEMDKAQAQLAEFEKQMAAMPESQRAMIMQRMGPQMQMMQKMGAGGGLEIESKLVEMRCNGGVPDALEVATTTFGGGVGGVGGVAGVGGAPAPRERTAPYYVDEKGVGVIRHSGSPGQFFLDVKRTTGDLIAGPMGPYAGPNVGIFIGSLNMLGVPFDQVELELYQDNPRRTAVRFRPEINPKQAESIEDCGTVSAIGACSK